MSDAIDRYPTTQQATCGVCSWQWSQTINPKTDAHEPVECPACARERNLAKLQAVLTRTPR